MFRRGYCDRACSRIPRPTCGTRSDSQLSVLSALPFTRRVPPRVTRSGSVGREKAACVAAADGSNNPDLSSGRYGSGKPACVSDVFLSHEDINVLPDLSLLRHNTISNTWTGDP